MNIKQKRLGKKLSYLVSQREVPVSNLQKSADIKLALKTGLRRTGWHQSVLPLPKSGTLKIKVHLCMHYLNIL